jgi:hypothetical protein
MQEYFNLDIQDNFSLNAPQEIKNKNKQDKSGALLSSKYIENNKNIGQITVMTPPLRCSRVRVWPGKNNKYSKCVIELETTDNEWRFKQFLTDLSDKCRYLLTENSKKWFSYTFSASAMRDTYVNMFVNKNYKHNEPEKIQIQLGKLLLNNLDKQTAKSYRNQYLVLRIVFKGVLVSDGVFSEVWRADQIFKARANLNDSDESEYDDDQYEDIGETLNVLSVQNKKDADNSVNVKEIKTEKTQNDKKGTLLLQVEKISDDNKLNMENEKEKESKKESEKEKESKKESEKEKESKKESENENEKEKESKKESENENEKEKESENEKESDTMGKITDSLKVIENKEDNKELSENKRTLSQKNKVENGENKEPKKSKKSQKKQRRKKIIISNNRKRNW